MLKDGIEMKEEIIIQYKEKLYIFIKKRVSDESIAKDILQDVLIKIYTKIDTLKDNDSLSKWVYQIAKNKIIDFYKTKKPTEELHEWFLVPEEDDNNGINENENCMLPIINSLPKIYKEALLLHEIEGISQKEIAGRLSLSYSTIKSRVQRGRNMLKNSLKQCCNFQFDKYGNIMDYKEKGRSCPGNNI